jgi:hypothetical protein
MPLQESDFFKGAGDEYTARLQARNRILLHFITVSSALIGISVAEKTGGFAFIAIGVGFFSLASTLLSRHHELMMAHLIAYQKLLVLDCKTTPECTAWHDFRQDQVPRIRRGRDWAVLALHGGFCLAALLIAFLREYFNPDWPKNMRILKWWVLGFSAASSIVSAMYIINTLLKRTDLSIVKPEERRRLRQTPPVKR